MKLLAHGSLCLIIFFLIGLVGVTTVSAENQPGGSTIVSPQTVAGTWGPGTITAASNVVINAGVVITVAPGTTIVVNGNYAITVTGELRVNGPVTFTASTATPGAWQGIVYAPTGRGYLNGATVEYAQHALTLNAVNAIPVSNSTLRYNRHAPAANQMAFGAGLYIQQGNHPIQNTRIYNNVATSSGTGEVRGAGIYIVGGSPYILNSWIYENTATSAGSVNGIGGGIGIVGGSPLIESSYILSNTLSGGTGTLKSGGGIGIGGSTATVIQSSWIAGNRINLSAGNAGGGGIGFATNGTATSIERSVIYNNYIYGPNWCEGGGIDTWDTTNSVVIVNNLIAGNSGGTCGSSSPYGGGINMNGNAVGVHAINNTIVNNVAAQGGGIYMQGGTVFATNNILVNNRATVAGQAGGIQRGAGTANYNDIFSNSTPQTVGTIGANNRYVDPLFLGLGDMVGYYHLSNLSPLIDQGTSTGTGIPVVDYDGNSRPLLGGRDMGFDEVPGPIAGVQIAKTVSPLTEVRPKQPITFTILFRNIGPATATNVVLTDIIPAGINNLSYVSSGATLTPIPGYTYAWQVANLASGAGGLITITGQVGAQAFAQTVRNVVEIGASNGTKAGGAAFNVCRTIQCLIDTASPGETVVVPAGIYTETLTLNKAVSVTGVSSATVIVRAPTNNRVMLITGTLVTNDVLIANMTFANGNIAGNGGGLWIANGAQPRLEAVTISNNRATVAGGGIYINANNVTIPIRNSVIRDNRVTSNNATTRGGGIAATGAGINLSLSGVTLSGNVADYYYGGAVALDGNTGTSYLTLDRSTVTYNRTTSNNGGGIYANRAVVTVTNSTLSNNRTAIAGGAFYANYAGTTLVVRDSVIESNAALTSTLGQGAGIYLGGQGSRLDLSNTRLAGNQAQYQGGAVYVNGVDVRVNLSAGTVITNNRVTRNDATNARGGGLYVFGIGARLTVDNSTMANNASDYSYGGAVCIDGNTTGTAYLSLTGSQVSGNQAVRLSGGGIYANRTVITVTNSTLSGNQAPNTAADVYGGALYAVGAGTRLTLNNSTVSGNLASAAGGGLYVSDATARVSISGSVITANVTTRNTTNSLGGGLYLNGSGATLTIANSTLANNTVGQSGGALYAVGNASTIISLRNTTISGNTATNVSGGGLYLNATTNTLYDSVIRNNTANALNADGGGAYLSGGTTTISNTHILANTANDEGGGAYNSSNLTLVKSTFSGNVANDDGGGLFMAGGTLTLGNSTFSGNRAQTSADADGGALYYNSTGAGNVYNATFFGNSASRYGGGIAKGINGTLTNRNTLVAGNTAGTNNNCYGTLGAGINNLTNDTSCAISAGFAQHTNALLVGALANNGGATPTHMLLAGNPAVNGGDATTCNNTPVSGQDQRGVPRPQGSVCDIGAVEVPATLALAKSRLNENGGALYPGETIVYTLILSNSSALANTNVVISDTFPAHTTYVPGSLTIDPSSAGGHAGVQPTLAEGITLAANSSATVRYAVVVDSPLAVGTVIVNRASATSNEVASPAAATVSESVANVPPVATDDTANVSEDSMANLIAVIPNDSDANADSLTLAALGTPDNGGAVVINGTAVAYTPAANFFGTETFTYTVSDGNGGSDMATVRVTVTNVNDAPTAVDDAYTAGEDSAANAFGVRANDSILPDAGETLTIVAVGAANGTATTDGATVSYTPGAAFQYLAAGESATDTFTYTIGDGNGGFDTATIAVTVTGANDAPVANGDTATTGEDGSRTVAVLANDTDTDTSDVLSIIGVNTTGTRGSVVNNGVTLTYNPGAAFQTLAVGDSETDVFTYTVNDGHGGLDTAVVVMTITGVNDAPAAVDDIAATDEETALTVAAPGVLSNDTEVDAGDVLSVTAFDATSAAGVAVTMAADGGYGYDPTGVAAFQALGAGETQADSFTYTVSDPHGGHDTATVRITVSGVNDVPVAQNDTATTDEDVYVLIPVLSNDSDVDAHDVLGVSAVTAPAHGTVVNNVANLLYTPAPNFHGADVFTYTASDGKGGLATAQVAITVNPVNDRPVAGDDAATTAEDTSVAVNVLTNDTDADGDALSVDTVIPPAHGAVIFAADVVTYTPAANFSGADSFIYRMNDGHGGSDLAIVRITVTPINDTPVAVDDAAATAEDTAVTVAVLANDSDADGDALTLLVVGAAGHGAVVNNGADMTYTPDVNFHGTDSFTYTIADGNGGEATATVALTVASVNDTPVATDDAGTLAEGATLTVAAPGVLDNDGDADGDALTALLLNGPAHGVLVLDASGAFTYTHDGSETTADSFTYQAFDGAALSNAATVRLTIDPVNDAPVALDDVYHLAQNGTLTVTVPGILGNDTDADGDTLTAALGTGPVNGALTLNADGSFVYVHNGSETTRDGFTYLANDGVADSAVATVTLVIGSANEPPVALDDAATTAEETPVVIAVLTNDTDPDSDPLLVTTIQPPAHGVVTNHGSEVTYTPARDYVGSDIFTYTVSDGLASDTASVQITVTPLNDAPVAYNDAATTDEDTSVTIALLANDSDVDGDTLSVQSVIQPAHGAVTNNGADVTYAPAANFNGADSFVYVVEDGQGGTDMAVVIVTVNPVNDAPAAAGDMYTVDEGAALVIAAPGVLSNDGDVEDDALTAALVSSPAHGVLVFDASGAFTYTHDGGESTADNFTYQVSDPQATGAVATVALMVRPVNDAPVAHNDAYAVDEGGLLTIAAPGVLENDTDTDGGVLTVVLMSGPAHGTLTLNADGSFTYTHDGGETTVDSFTYRAADGEALSELATVQLSIGAQNDTPVAAGDAYDTDEGGVLAIAAPGVLGNDADADGDTLTAVLISDPLHGTLTFNADGSFTYTHDGGETTADSFTYQAYDGSAYSAVATVTLTIKPVNDAPVATDDAYSLNEGATLDITAPGVLSNDTDADGNVLSAVLVSGPTHGTLTFNANGAFIYVHDGSETTADGFTYRVSDGQAESAVATVVLTIGPVNDAPVAADDAYTLDEGATLDIAAPGVLGNDTDADGGALMAVLISGPAHGALTFNADGSFIYIHDDSETTADSFTYRASDGQAESAVTMVALTIRPVNQAPHFTSTPVTLVSAAEVYSYTVVAVDPDAGDSLAIAAGTLPVWLSLQDFGDGSAVLTGTPPIDAVGLYTIELHVTDSGALSNTQRFGLRVLGGKPTATPSTLFLPLVSVQYASMVYYNPDLVVMSLTATSNNIQVVIKNQGNAPVMDAFWVQVYIDPVPAPTHVNQLWYDLSGEGLVWGVVEPALPLRPGDVLTLTYKDAYYWPTNSRFLEALVPGTPVYAQVDAYNAETTYGAVLELHERSGEAYNNIFGPVYASQAQMEAVAPASHTLSEQITGQAAALPSFPRFE